MCVPMLGLLTWAAVVDLRARRIPNWLTASMALAGLAQSWSWAHTVTPGQSMLGFLTGFGLTFVFFGIGAMGGGDVKLMAALGAWLGPMPTLVVFAAAAVIGMAFVVAQAAVQGRLGSLFRNSAVIAVSFANAGEIGLEQAADTGKACSGSGRPLPYAVPVLLATILTIHWMR
jgi:prepilin peptidase CpaA